ncbi:hypothetical protein CERSUDRAFT_117777 [Gelatoporia subvermispora B]|uniref:Zn(2)-C6 fungal-type domain-containing protein n=1 Tax=Ceriporiopsis subvermispora (strain B) TaxID=914234 RepID=M2R440_CERS8|nr:hypothetical protein CERSUDRAFT_117777 [Gelatoporia subvermispora B]
MSSPSASVVDSTSLGSSFVAADDVLQLLTQLCGQSDRVAQVVPDTPPGNDSSPSASPSSSRAGELLHPSYTMTWVELYTRDMKRSASPAVSSIVPTPTAVPSAVFQYRAGTKDIRTIDAQHGDQVGSSHTTPTSQIHVGRVDTRLHQWQRHQVGMVNDRDSESPVEPRGASTGDARRNESVQINEPGPSYPIIFHIPEYLPGLGDDLIGRRSKGKKRRVLDAPEGVIPTGNLRKFRGHQEVSETTPARATQEGTGHFGGGRNDTGPVETAPKVPEPKYGACGACRKAKRKCHRIGNTCKSCVATGRVVKCRFQPIRPGGRPRKNAIGGMSNQRGARSSDTDLPTSAAAWKRL